METSSSSTNAIYCHDVAAMYNEGKTSNPNPQQSPQVTLLEPNCRCHFEPLETCGNITATMWPQNLPILWYFSQLMTFPDTLTITWVIWMGKPINWSTTNLVISPVQWLHKPHRRHLVFQISSSQVCSTCNVRVTDIFLRKKTFVPSDVDDDGSTNFHGGLGPSFDADSWSQELSANMADIIRDDTMFKLLSEGSNSPFDQQISDTLSEEHFAS